MRQIRLGNGPKTRGTAFVVYEEVADVSRSLSPQHRPTLDLALTLGCPMLQAKQAFDHLNGFHLQERYLVGACLLRSPRWLPAPAQTRHSLVDRC